MSGAYRSVYAITSSFLVLAYMMIVQFWRCNHETLFSLLDFVEIHVIENSVKVHVFEGFQTLNLHFLATTF